MTRFFNRRPKVFGCIIGVLIASLVGFPVFNTSAFSAAAPAEEGAKLSKKEKKELVETGVAQYERGNIDQAKETLEKAQAVFPENYAVPFYLGLIYLQEGQRSAAIAEWQRYVAMDPQSENAMKIRKDLTLLLREEAREYARQAIANEALLPSGAADDNTVAVTTFKNLGSADLGPLGKGMAAMVIHDLTQVPDLHVVERIKLQVLLEEMKLGTTGLVDAQTAPQVGQLLKARHVTAGSLADLEKQSLQIASVVVDAQQDETLGTREVQGALQKFYDLEKKIACGIIEDLGKDCDKVPGAFGKIHTKSLPALVAFSYGLDRFDEGDYDAAREKFQEALDEDPEFDLAQEALWATPYSAMVLMTTSQMISSASASGVSSTAAGSAVVASAGGVGIGTTAAIVGGAALIGGGAAALGGGGGGENGGGSNENIAGEWRGTWIDSDGTSGDFLLNLNQTDASVSGTASVNNSECISTGSVNGTVSGNNVAINIVSGQDLFSLSAVYNVSSKTMNGNYEVISGSCVGDTGNFSTTLTGGAVVRW